MTATINVVSNGGGFVTISGNNGKSAKGMVAVTMSSASNGVTLNAHTTTTDDTGAFSYSTLIPSGELIANLFVIDPVDADSSSPQFP